MKKSAWPKEREPTCTTSAIDCTLLLFLANHDLLNLLTAAALDRFLLIIHLLNGFHASALFMTSRQPVLQCTLSIVIFRPSTSNRSLNCAPKWWGKTLFFYSSHLSNSPILWPALVNFFNAVALAV